MRQLLKQFRWWFLSRQWLSFRWLFQSQKRLCALTSPCVSSGTSFGDEFWGGSDSVFLHYFWVNRGGVRWRIHASVLEAVSVTISESVTTQFSLIVSDAIRAVCANESMRQLWTQFRCWILSRHRLGFPWLFQTQQGLCALTNPCVTCGSSFGYHFWVGSDSLFLNYF
jgi:hypothetical protein